MAEDEVVVQLEASQSSVSARQHLVVVFYMLHKCSIAMFVQGASMNANVAISLADCDVESKENVYAGESSQNEVINHPYRLHHMHPSAIRTHA